MARFYFDLRDGEFFRDEEGVELPDAEAAQFQAFSALQEMLQWSQSTHWNRCAVDVRDEADQIVFRVSAEIKIEKSDGATVLHPFQPNA